MNKIYESPIRKNNYIENQRLTKIFKINADMIVNVRKISLPLYQQFS